MNEYTLTEEQIVVVRDMIHYVRKQSNKLSGAGLPGHEPHAMGGGCTFACGEDECLARRARRLFKWLEKI